MTTDEKHARIADALRGVWREERKMTTTAALAKASGLSADQVRSVSGGYVGAGRSVQVGSDRIRVQYNRGHWRLSPEEGWDAYWARQPEAPF
jgi:hypothetical protein